MGLFYGHAGRSLLQEKIGRHKSDRDMGSRPNLERPVKREILQINTRILYLGCFVRWSKRRFKSARGGSHSGSQQGVASGERKNDALERHRALGGSVILGGGDTIALVGISQTLMLKWCQCERVCATAGFVQGFVGNQIGCGGSHGTARNGNPCLRWSTTHLFPNLSTPFQVSVLACRQNSLCRKCVPNELPNKDGGMESFSPALVSF